MFCSNCGKELQDQVKFCSSCGNHVESIKTDDLTIVNEKKVDPKIIAFNNADETKLASDLPTLDQDNHIYAGFWRRGAALSIDGIIMSLIGAILLFFIDSFINPFYWITSLAIAAFYNLYFIKKYHATPGKILIGLRIIPAHSQNTDLDSITIITRYIGSIFSALILGLGFLIQPFNTKKQAMHDYMSSTIVIDIAKKPSWIIWISIILYFVISNFINSTVAPAINPKAVSEFQEWLLNKQGGMLNTPDSPDLESNETNNFPENLNTSNDLENNKSGITYKNAELGLKGDERKIFTDSFVSACVESANSGLKQSGQSDAQIELYEERIYRMCICSSDYVADNINSTQLQEANLNLATKGFDSIMNTLNAKAEKQCFK